MRTSLSHHRLSSLAFALLIPACTTAGAGDDNFTDAGGVGGTPGLGGGFVGGVGATSPTGGAGIGGSAPVGVGGLIGAGGSSAAGGALGTGGDPGTGGDIGVGGSGLGGTVASGGAASGGNTASGGSGGGNEPAGLPCETSFTAAGHSGCLSTLGGIDTKYFPLAEGKKASRLAVYLHGDTAWEWYANGSLITDLLSWAKERDVVVAALLSPVAYAGDDPEDRSYGALNQSADVAKIGDALDELVAGLGVSPSELMFWSTSGGSWFLTSSFFPRLGGRFQGDFALSCGASTWAAGYAWDPAMETAKRDGFDIWFNYGSNDFLAPGVEWSLDHYQGKGIQVSETVYPGANHCAHAIVAPTIDYFTKRFK